MAVGRSICPQIALWEINRGVLARKQQFTKHCMALKIEVVYGLMLSVCVLVLGAGSFARIQFLDCEDIPS